ncbi:hypothetical protein MRB53_023982 [Persea americana]|uniref:Uncharacterized protein n=1 Tax=Persea americana TaxID=3435 RepID=A0ACC2LC99_PERAE|nr:hypothetical protein MRB53_023982 [Persea americana]
MPLKFWVDTFATSMYLINRLSVRRLPHLSPWEILFQQSPIYSSLRIFGSACYPWLKPYNLHKLDPKTKRCVFLGYGLNKKDYRGLDMDSGRIFLSRHVAFSEDFFPFSSSPPLTSSPVAPTPASFTPFQWLSSVTPPLSLVLFASLPLCLFLDQRHTFALSLSPSPFLHV